MRPPPFLYRPAHDPDEALELLARYGDDARLLAGGQSLVPLMNLRMGRPGVLVDLNRCEGLAYIEDRGGYVAYGPMVRQIDAQHSTITQIHCPLVAQALAWAGPLAVRNRGTVGGMLAHHDRSAELPGVAVAMGAVLIIQGRTGVREVSADAFFIADLVTAIRPGEMLREIRIPVSKTPQFSVFLEAGLRQRDMALVGLSFTAQLKPAGGFGSVNAVATAIDSRPLRLAELERVLVENTVAEHDLVEVVELATRSLAPIDDTHATGRYRHSVLRKLICEAVRQGMARPGGSN